MICIKTIRASILTLLLLHPLAAYESTKGKLIKNGIASWYGDESGKYTANGERFNPRAFTAACWFLPFNTLVKVTNLRTKKSVVVRINDRGPAKRLHRLIDLSQAAARRIGIKSIDKVKLEIV